MKSSNFSNVFRKYFLCFMFYSVLGWCYEVFLDVVIYRDGFIKRGFLFGTYCPVYGFGALAFISCLWMLKDKKIKVAKINITPVLVFLGIMLISTSMELVTSYILEIFTGSWLWDYTGYGINFQGRVALNPSVRFGIGGMFFLYICQPFLNKLMKNEDSKKLKIVFTIIFSIFVLDFLLKIGFMIF